MTTRLKKADPNLVTFVEGFLAAFAGTVLTTVPVLGLLWVVDFDSNLRAWVLLVLMLLAGAGISFGWLFGERTLIGWLPTGSRPSSRRMLFWSGCALQTLGVVIVLVVSQSDALGTPPKFWRSVLLLMALVAGKFGAFRSLVAGQLFCLLNPRGADQSSTDPPA